MGRDISLAEIQRRADEHDADGGQAIADRRDLLDKILSTVLHQANTVIELEKTRFLLGAIYYHDSSAVPAIIAAQAHRHFGRQYEEYQRMRRAWTPHRLAAWLACHGSYYLGAALAKIGDVWSPDWLVNCCNRLMDVSLALNVRYAFARWPSTPHDELLPNGHPSKS